MENTKENIGEYIDSSIIQYSLSNTDKLIDYYKQIIEPIQEISLDYLKLQKDYINASQPQWIEHIKNIVNNYLVFQDKMLMLYLQMFTAYIKYAGNIKAKKEDDKRIMERSRTYYE